MYEAHGSVRGSCGHSHRSIRTAHVCAADDREACRRLPGGNAYSDRSVRAIEPRAFRPHELDQLDEVRCA